MKFSRILISNRFQPSNGIIGHARSAIVIEPLINPVFLVDGRKQVAVPADILGITEKQKSIRLEGEMEDRKNLRLEIRSEIDEQVTT